MLLLKATSTLSELRAELLNSLNQSNILNIRHKVEDTDDAAIPKPSFGEIDDDNIAEPEKTQAQLLEEGDIKIGLPNDKNNDFLKGFKDITGEDAASLDSLGVKDGSILAFSVHNEPFEIELPDYNDPE